jgi:hypothetical protein
MMVLVDIFVDSSSVKEIVENGVEKVVDNKIENKGTQ